MSALSSFIHDVLKRTNRAVLYIYIYIYITSASVCLEGKPIFVDVIKYLLCTVSSLFHGVIPLVLHVLSTVLII